LELSTQWPVNLKHTGSFLLPAAWAAWVLWPVAVSPVAGGVPELVLLETGAEGADDEAGAAEDCPAVGASWPWAIGIVARIAAARAAVTAAAVKKPVFARSAALNRAPGRPNATEVAKSGTLPINLVVRLTFDLP
jgi:hypothetical protein